MGFQSLNVNAKLPSIISIIEADIISYNYGSETNTL